MVSTLQPDVESVLYLTPLCGLHCPPTSACFRLHCTPPLCGGHENAKNVETGRYAEFQFLSVMFMSGHNTAIAETDDFP